MMAVQTVDRSETTDVPTVAPVRVAVVDDHESVRLGLKAAFLDEGYDFVLAASTVDELIHGLRGRPFGGERDDAELDREALVAEIAPLRGVLVGWGRDRRRVVHDERAASAATCRV